MVPVSSREAGSVLPDLNDARTLLTRANSINPYGLYDRSPQLNLLLTGPVCGWSIYAVAVCARCEVGGSSESRGSVVIASEL